MGSRFSRLSVSVPAPSPVTRRRLGLEVWLVLGLSLGRSGWYALLSLIDRPA